MFVNNKGARHVSIGNGIRLMPGVNTVDDAAWKRAMGKSGTGGPALKALLNDTENGLVVMGGGSSSPTPTGTGPSVGGTAMRDSATAGAEASAGTTATTSTAGSSAGNPGSEDLSTMTVHEATAIIGETYDKPTLQAWKKADSRKGIKDAIDSQLEILKLEDKK